MRKKTGLVLVLATVAGLAATPAHAWSYSWRGVVSTTTYTSGSSNWVRLYDTSSDGVPVRGQYTRSDDVDYNVYNANGWGTYATGPTSGYRTVAVILCNDYPIGDDCSPKHYG